MSSLKWKTLLHNNSTLSGFPESASSSSLLAPSNNLAGQGRPTSTADRFGHLNKPWWLLQTQSTTLFCSAKNSKPKADLAA